MKSSLTGNLVLKIPDFSYFTLFSGIVILCLSLYLCYVFISKKGQLSRPSVLFSALVVCFFGWPFFIFSNIFQMEVENHWLFFSSVYISPAILFLWAHLTETYPTKVSNIIEPYNKYYSQLALLIFGLTLLVILYLSYIPFDCTALYALINEPELSLLAREFSMKFFTSSIPGYAIGVLVNVVAPIIIVLNFDLAKTFFFKRYYIKLTFLILLTFLVILCVLLTGTKGSLLPIFIMIICVSLFWNIKIINKLISAGLAIIFILASIFVIEFRKDIEINHDILTYKFGSCSVRMNACNKSKILLESAQHRDFSLNLTRKSLGLLIEDLERECLVRFSQKQSPVLKPKIDHIEISKLSLSNYIHTYIKGLFYRANVTPLQVGSWHFKYAEDYGAPGIAGILPERFYKTSKPISVPQEVYQKYGTIFSGGDTTSTSSAPTSFVLAYPAYLGYKGIAIVITLIILLDVIFIMITHHLKGKLKAIGIGVFAIICMNLLLSDYLAVMIAHGGVAGICLLAFFAIMQYLQDKRHAIK